MLQSISSTAAAPVQKSRTDALREKASQLEVAFLSEMLGHTGLGKAGESFNGGIGEEQFASFLRQEQASLIVKKGGIGLAESLFKSMSEHSNVK